MAFTETPTLNTINNSEDTGMCVDNLLSRQKEDTVKYNHTVKTVTFVPKPWGT